MQLVIRIWTQDGTDWDLSEAGWENIFNEIKLGASEGRFLDDSDIYNGEEFKNKVILWKMRKE